MHKQKSRWDKTSTSRLHQCSYIHLMNTSGRNAEWRKKKRTHASTIPLPQALLCPVQKVQKRETHARSLRLVWTAQPWSALHVVEVARHTFTTLKGRLTTWEISSSLNAARRMRVPTHSAFTATQSTTTLWRAVCRQAGVINILYFSKSDAAQIECQTEHTHSHTLPYLPLYLIVLNLCGSQQV